MLALSCLQALCQRSENRPRSAAQRKDRRGVWGGPPTSSSCGMVPVPRKTPPPPSQGRGEDGARDPGRRTPARARPAHHAPATRSQEPTRPLKEQQETTSAIAPCGQQLPGQGHLRHRSGVGTIHGGSARQALLLLLPASGRFGLSRVFYLRHFFIFSDKVYILLAFRFCLQTKQNKTAPLGPGCSFRIHQESPKVSRQ